MNFLKRFLAYIIDLVIVSSVAVVIQIFIPFNNNAFAVVAWLVYLLYATVAIWKYSATVGKRLFKLKVVNVNGDKVPLVAVLFRESIGKLISGMVCSLGYLWVLIDKRGQAWHDKLAKTIVVSTDRDIGTKVTTIHKVVFFLLFFLLGIPLTFLPIFQIVAYIYIPVQQQGQSMTPTYSQGSDLLVNKISYRRNLPQRGDVIVLRESTKAARLHVKRIVGIPGDKIMIKEGEVFINDVKLDESAYLAEGTNTLIRNYPQDGSSIVIPEGRYFIMGDNRERSSDSREFGPIALKSIVGKVLFCYQNCPIK